MTSIEETVVEQNSQVEVLESYFPEQCVSTERPKQVRLNRSHLWAQINHDDLEAIENKQISPECMEEHHRIHPISNKRRAVNPNMYNPRKVCMIISVPNFIRPTRLFNSSTTVRKRIELKQLPVEVEVYAM